MANLVALDSHIHRNLRVSRRLSREAAEVNVASVIPREFQRLVAHYPIFFIKSTSSGRFEPAALLGFQPKENLYWTNGEWQVAYVPLQIQRQPFSLLPGENQISVAIDMSSSQLGANDGELLFLDDGQPSKYLQNITSMLYALVSGSTEAYEFTARLAELDLFEPVRIDVTFVDQSEAKLQGLYWIASAALKALPATQLAELRDRDFLEWVYFQMASVSHMSGLVARKNELLSGVTPQPRTE
jgi:hypothetical protein